MPKSSIKKKVKSPIPPWRSKTFESNFDLFIDLKDFNSFTRDEFVKLLRGTLPTRRRRGLKRKASPTDVLLIRMMYALTISINWWSKFPNNHPIYKLKTKSKVREFVAGRRGMSPETVRNIIERRSTYR